MALNVISNYAANVAHRNLMTADAQMSSSLAKLSAGTRVVSAKDDAASLAIGKRLEADVAALKQAQVNAGQASSMLQIADGALSTISDMLVRMKALSVQAASGQLGTQERGFLNDEFGTLRSEINRIVDDTEFNGTVLLNGSNTFGFDTVGANVEQADGFENFSFGGNPGATFLSTGDELNITYSSTTKQFTITNVITSTTETSAAISGDPGVGTFTDVTFGQFGVTIKLNSQFDSTAAITGTTTTNQIQVTGGSSTSLSLTFKVGTSNASSDDVTISVKQAKVAQLAAGLDTDVLSTVAAANTTIGNVQTAINKLNEIRSDIGGAQNRVEFAASNLAATVENTEAARSSLLDLDVAKEISVFTSKKVLAQAGIAMLAQANQIPQNLLRLLQ